jgi:type 2 lantibiotic biosynthesis protein LanM
MVGHGRQEQCLDDFFARLMVRAATIDEILSDDFETLAGQKEHAGLATRRLAAWCRSSASGDWSLFSQRLRRDRLSVDHALARFATVRRACVPRPAWIDDATWIETTLQSPTRNIGRGAVSASPCPFEDLFNPLVDQADALVWASVDARAFGNLTESARACLRHSLLNELSHLCTPAIYERLVAARNAAATSGHAREPQRDGATSLYDRFVAEMKAGGFRHLFTDKPVLLRLIASVTRQWIDASREFVIRLDADLPAIGRDILGSSRRGRVAEIEGELSDPHNGGRSVKIATFETGDRIVYKPKDLRVDVAWYSLIERLNGANPPIALKAARTIARDGHGWSEFIDHSGCGNQEEIKLFFRRAGGWLALFHLFAATDLHQRNMIACGNHPVPIDLEMVLQTTAADNKTEEIEGQAFEAATEMVTNSVAMVGLLPTYGKSHDNSVFEIGGMISDWNFKTKIAWNDINSDKMRPVRAQEVDKALPNLPHLNGRYAKFGDHIEDFVSGFEAYAKFLLDRTRDTDQSGLFGGFAGGIVRKVIRPTRFYYMLLQRLRDHRTMDDGIIWSAQADFPARLADYDKENDPLWPLQRAERAALVTLNVPYFVLSSDGNDICDATGILVETSAASGIDRARARVRSFHGQDIALQIEIIRENASSASRSVDLSATKFELRELVHPEAPVARTTDIFVAEAGEIAGELSRHAIRRGPGAAWIGLEWLGDSEVSQLAPLGPDLYNGFCGIAVFLAAHAAVSGSKCSEEPARAAVSHLRKNLRSRNAARMARALGIGGATGLGSIVYALAVMSKCLKDPALAADAHGAAELFTDDLIAADRQLDVMGGSAGGILGLLRLYRDSSSPDVLKRATLCGEHLLAQPRVGPAGSRTWAGQGPQPLTGMSHGAAGFAYALASLAAVTGREEFATAATECLAFENSSYDANHSNWPDLREAAGPSWPCRWCHGAIGIGLARIATARRGGLDSKLMEIAVRNALAGEERCWPAEVDTLCCGTFGGIEFLCEAGDALQRRDLQDLAVWRLRAVVETAASTGDYRWNVGKRRFNLGLFRGLAGAGYTLLRRADNSLPNVLIWD